MACFVYIYASCGGQTIDFKNLFAAARPTASATTTELRCRRLAKKLVRDNTGYISESFVKRFLEYFCLSSSIY